MSTSKQQDGIELFKNTVYANYIDSREKNDRLVLTLVVGMIAYIGQSYDEIYLTSYSGVLTLISLLLLISSAIYGYTRIEASSDYYWENYLSLDLESEILRQKASLGTLSYEGQRKLVAEKLGKLQTKVEEMMQAAMDKDKTNEKYRKLRNKLAFLGICILVVSKVTV